MTLDEITKTLVNLEADEITKKVKAELDAGTDPKKILKALTDGMNEIGELYEKKEYYLTELVLAGEMMKDTLKILGPKLKAEEYGRKEKIICATVRGDNHDIGKNILKLMLLSAGFEVIDLGKDCPENKIVKAVKKSEAKIVALSALLTMTIEEIAVVDKALKDAGLRDQVKLIVGGAPLDMEVAKKMGADDYAADAISGVRHIKALLEM
ncbi:MAG: cobalamin B12-binding domain-containing protein [Candidatus Helarchaeota archaeon]